MSRFFSPKYLKYRRPVREASVEIVEDVPCPRCGYNLRGLATGRNCPECGHRIRRGTPRQDVLLSVSEAERRAWTVGLALAAACVLLATVARVGFFLAGAFVRSDALVTAYLLVGTANAGLWIVAVWLITPASLDSAWAWMRRPRLVARALAVLWLVGYGCLLARYDQNLASAIEAWLLLGDRGGRLLGGLGALVVAFIMSWIAEEAELERAARRLNSSVWMLWIPTLLAQAFPAGIAWFGLVVLGWILFFWCWLMMQLALGLFALSRHGHWATIHRIQAAGRSARIVETRRELSAQAARTVRPMPRRSAGDVPEVGPSGEGECAADEHP